MKIQFIFFDPLINLLGIFDMHRKWVENLKSIFHRPMRHLINLSDGMSFALEWIQIMRIDS